MWCTWQIGCLICDADLYFNFWVWRIHKIDPKNFSSTYFSYPIKTFLDFFFNIYIYNIRLALITKTDLDYQGWVFVILILNEKKVWNEINTKTINLSIKTFIHRDFTVSFVFCWSVRAWQRDGFWPYWLSYFYDDISH